MTSIHSFLALPKLFEQIDFVMFLGNMDTLWNTRKPEESLIDNNHRLYPREEQLLWACWYLEQTELSHAVLSPRLSVKHAAMARCSQSKYDMYDTLVCDPGCFESTSWFMIHDSRFWFLGSTGQLENHGISQYLHVLSLDFKELQLQVLQQVTTRLMQWHTLV